MQSIQNKCNYYNTGWLTTYIYIDIHKKKSLVDREEDADDSAWLAAPKRKGDPRFGIESTFRGTLTYDLLKSCIRWLAKEAQNIWTILSLYSVLIWLN